MRQAAAYVLFIALLGTAALAATDDLAAAYRKGRLTLTADPGFAPGADWGTLFFDRNRRVKVAPDGSIFVANTRGLFPLAGDELETPHLFRARLGP